MKLLILDQVHPAPCLLLGSSHSSRAVLLLVGLIVSGCSAGLRKKVHETGGLKRHWFRTSLRRHFFAWCSAISLLDFVRVIDTEREAEPVADPEHQSRRRIE